MIKVGIPIIIRGNNWLGGVNYFKSLATSLNAITDDKITVYFLTNNKNALDGAAGQCVQVVECKELNNFSLLSRAVNFITGTHWGIVKVAKRYNLDILTHACPSKYLNIPALYWVPDFQHCVLKNIFTRKDRWSRDKYIQSTLLQSDILFSSYSAERDFRYFYPKLSNVKSHVLQFTPVINFDKSNINSVSYLQEKYDIGAGYFYLPNQFWKHKNHKVVAEALKLLPSDFQVVCSGALVDYRGSKHIEELKSFVEKNGLNQRFRMLGVVPREDVYCLLDHALAVINPSFFEGWSTTVEEAKYSGKRLILSDINVHKEQNPMDALFFDPTSAPDLAAKMKVAKDQFNSALEEQRFIKAKLAYPIASAEFADAYVKIVKELLNKVY